MAKEQQLPLAFDFNAQFAALRLDITDVERMMDNLERSVGKKPTPRKAAGRNPILDLQGKELPEGGRAAAQWTEKPKVLSLGAQVVGNKTVGDLAIFIHVVDRGRLEVTAYGHKDRSIELVNPTYNKAGEGERITFKAHGHQVVVNVDAKFRTGSAYFQVGEMKIGVAELKECPLNPFED